MIGSTAARRLVSKHRAVVIDIAAVILIDDLHLQRHIAIAELQTLHIEHNVCT